MSFLAPAKQPPANLEAEQALLGALLANNRAYERVAGFLKPEHFADQLVHARIYTAIQRRIEAGRVADAVTLRSEFENSGLLEDCPGGTAYLGQLLTAMVGIINVGEYGRVIEDAWLRRELIDLAQTVSDSAHGTEPFAEARSILEAADSRLVQLAERRGAAARDGHQVAGVALERMLAAIDRRGALAGVTTGFRALDRMTGGFMPGQFVLLGGRPSMGKTSLAWGIARGAALAGHRVLFVSAEMASEGVMARAIACESGLPLSAVLRGGIDDAGQWRALDRTSPEVAQIGDAARRIGALPIVWDDQAFTAAAIRTTARRMQREPGGLGLIVVDYLGRLRASENASRFGQVSAVTELSAAFKDMAMVLGVPVLMLSQLNRTLESRDDKTPMMSDLRDSGALEQDADMVLFLYRAHYYLTRNEPRRRATEKGADYEQRAQDWMAEVARERGRATVIVAKNRQGPIGPVRLRFHDATTRFSDEGEDYDARS